MKSYNLTIVIVLFFTLIINGAKAQDFEGYKYEGDKVNTKENVVKTEFQFNGYTNYWHDSYTNWYRYGNLFKMAVPDVEKTIQQSKVDIAEDLGMPGFTMQEGFMTGLLSEKYTQLNQPSADELERKLKKENVLVFVDPGSDVGKKLIEKLPPNKWQEILKSHQYGAVDLKRAEAFYLENGDVKLFVVSSSDQNTRDKIKDRIENTKEIVAKYDFHKGWFGAYTLLNSVTCTPGHPIEVMGEGMNEGCDWFVFEGYMDFMSKDEIAGWIDEVKLPVVTDVGATNLFGCKNWDNFQIQQMYDKESWIKAAKEREGYVFRNVMDLDADPYTYDGYFAQEGNKFQIDNEDVPFVLKTGKLEDNALSSMVLFLKKGKKLTQESMWEAILDRREVGVIEKGKMMGPANYRNALQMLLLDRQFLEEYFGDRINIETTTDGYDLQVTLANSYSHPVSGELKLVLPPQLKLSGNVSEAVNLPAGTTTTMHYQLMPTAAAMDNANSVAVRFTWDKKEKSTLALLDLPPAISVHRLLYGHTPKVEYPVTIHNFTAEKSFPVKVEVLDGDNVVFETTQQCKTAQSTFKDMLFNLELQPGNYNVKVSAMGVGYTSQLGVGKAEGKPYAYEIDLNNDGVKEFRMENDSVQITLLRTGARVIEYIVKSREDNILFKLWPKKAIDDKRAFRKRGYYPYGGFEDFLGQASMETHQVYNAELVKADGDFVRVRMWTDYYGNRIEKTFTLYGDTPLLEVRFALTFKNREATMLGPQPILELGEKHWTEDAFYVPEMSGIHEFRMDPDKYYGQAFKIKEGWNSGYDTKEDITFVGAYPVDQPMFLHMWQNHPSNPSAHHYYAEFQPWLPIFQKSTMYFTYYLYGAGGPWENGVQWLRERNLITTR